MTFERLKSFDEYWRKYPPAHILLKMYVGYVPPKTQAEKDKEAYDNMKELFSKLGGYNKK